jgi:hypothetical protein
MLTRWWQALVRSLGGTPTRQRRGRVAGPAAVTSRQVSGRTVSYAPKPNGRADPGEVVWTLVAYDDDPFTAKDRPVLIVGRKDPRTVLALMLSSQSHRSDDRHWMPLGPGVWDRHGRPSWVRLDRVLELSDKGIRREGAVLDAARFGRIAQVLQKHYGWK